MFFFFPDDAVPGSTEVPPRAEEEVGVRGFAASPAGSLLHSCSSPTALHHRDENEEHANAGKEQGRRRRDDLRHGARVRGASSLKLEGCCTFTLCPGIALLIILMQGAIL